MIARTGLITVIAGLCLLVAPSLRADVAPPPPDAPSASSSGEDEGVRLKVKVAGGDSVWLTRGEDGALLYEIENGDQAGRRLTPDEFAALVYEDRTTRPWWQVLLNITTPLGIAWVVLGLLGQILFTGRMLVQWLVSERNRRSTVPVAFWWMSLGGATMLLTYFIWRKDIVGVLGQATGWLIYVRNLWMIYRADDGPKIPATTDPAPEPELAK